MSNKKSSANVGILGYGEVGKAIAKFYKHPKIKDKGESNDLSGVEFLHVCIPYTKDFIKIVKEEIRIAQPSITIIHSTVPVGTTRKIADKIVHSPVRGIHPYLHEHIKNFVKYIGAVDIDSAFIVAKHFTSLGIETDLFFTSEATELGKLLDTTYYGLCIAFHGEAKKMCKRYGLSFKEVMTYFNETYNEGYLKAGKKNVIRPVLDPPYKNRIGGHCIIPNAKMLKKSFKSKAIDLVLDYEKKQ